MQKAFTALAISTVVGALAVLGGATHSGATAPPGSSTTARMTINPADFGHPVVNPWFPLEPGTTTLLRGTDGAERCPRTTSCVAPRTT